MQVHINKINGGTRNEDIDVPRIYRLRTNDNEYKTLYKFRCFNWDENILHLESTDTSPIVDDITENIKNGLWLWTVEWIDESEGNPEND